MVRHGTELGHTGRLAAAVTALVDWLFARLVPDWLFELLLRAGARLYAGAYAGFAGDGLD